MSDPAIQPEHAEVELLLPWYVNESLSSEESDRVAEHLESCATCRSAVEEHRRVANVVEADAATPLVPSPPVDDFLQMIESQDVVGNDRGRWWTMSLAASVLVFLAAGLLFFVADKDEDTNLFQTVSNGQSDTGIAYVFNVAYTEGEGESVRDRMSDLFADAELVEIDGGYRMVIPLQSATMTELEKFAESLQAMQGVRDVDVVGVQLPLE